MFRGTDLPGELEQADEVSVRHSQTARVRRYGEVAWRRSDMQCHVTPVGSGRVPKTDCVGTIDEPDKSSK